MAAETPTIVLVHGAWADATGFDAEIHESNHYRGSTPALSAASSREHQVVPDAGCYSPADGSGRPPCLALVFVGFVDVEQHPFLDASGKHDQSGIGPDGS